MMDLNLFLGIIAIISGYGMTWFLLLKSRKIIKIIDKKKLEHLREIQKELNDREDMSL